MENEKVVIDLFGCDNPNALILGVAEALRTIEDVSLIVTGSQAYIEEKLSGEEFDRTRLEIVDAPEIITNSDSPVSSVWSKKNSSLVKGCAILRDREEVKAMITAGSTGATIACAILMLGRETRDDRPTLVTFLPNEKGGLTCLTDCGANVDCKPEHLFKFATYASQYMNKVYGVENPAVGLLSVGTEDEKGNAQSKQTFQLLKDSDLNFKGNIEARSALTGEYDVIVSDGFSGNVLLKTVEGTAKTVAKMMGGFLKKHAGENTDTSFIKKAFGELYEKLDFNTMGGAVLLGVKKPIIKAHGSANAQTITHTVKQALAIAKSGYTINSTNKKNNF